ncbi:MAG TPA: penicillin-binding protein 2 [Acidimicrobiales bacterium]
MALLAFGAVVVKVVSLQTVDADRFQRIGEQQRRVTQILPADRGVIFDRNGYELALSIPATTFWADPRIVKQQPEGAAATANALTEVLGLEGDEARALRARLDRDAEFVYVARQVDAATAERIEALELAGVFSYAEARRSFPGGDLAQNLLGSADLDGVGSAGLEKQYEEVLRGRPGKLYRERDRNGRTIPTGRKLLEAPTPGDDLVLTIDRTLQYATEEALKKQVAATGARGGIVVVMDTKTGDLLALANVRSDAETHQPEVSKANLAVVDTYEPGSVAKIITAAAALQEKAVGPATVMQVPGQKQYYDHVFTDVHRHLVSAWTIEDIIAYSSNVGTMMLSQAIGPAKQEQYMRSFGLGDRTALQFPGESRGILPPSAKWRGTEKLTVSFGQGVAVTGVQLAAAMNTIANGGVYVAPRLVSATIDERGTERAAPASDQRTVLEPSVAGTMNEMLRSVICRGTGRRAALADYAVAGKTGTAYKAQTNGSYLDDEGNRHYVGSFAGFVPAEAPRLTILVSIDEPVGDHYGGLVATPVFQQVAQEALRVLQVPPSPQGGACPERDKGGE